MKIVLCACERVSVFVDSVCSKEKLSLDGLMMDVDGEEAQCMRSSDGPARQRLALH